MSHTRFISLNESQTITIIKHSLNKNIQVVVQDTFYLKEKVFSVFICEEEIKAVSILFEMPELNDLNKFFNFLCEIFDNPNNNRFYRLHLYFEPDLISLHIGVRNKYPNSGYIKDYYKFKLKEML